MTAKRIFDLIFSATGLILLSPLFLLIALAITLESDGPVFFRQERVGQSGERFRIHKFRSMRANAERHGALITSAGDSRITCVGAFLRKYKLDELPQLIDVIEGKMSLVGPRPEVPKYVAYYPDRLLQRILSMRPGVTGAASIAFKDENELLAASSDPEREYIDNILPAKLRYDERYVSQWSFWGDILIILQTLRALWPNSAPPHDGLNRHCSGLPKKEM